MEDATLGVLKGKIFEKRGRFRPRMIFTKQVCRDVST